MDIALITQVLPDPADTAKNLGLMDLAGNLPTSVSPALAPAILAIGATAAVPQNSRPCSSRARSPGCSARC
ncbi:hypothetical protein QRX60_32610 [Amycolatopsis mongoliensis]|uniref:Uncharacterized protein n=1 Tax=Amycolatopsis mongoliensis TaxID=715475 RepID=A0A9Y2NGL3_9PSEU|nr:hypothetical protein [Amycolatopsis sp. 4-36]WIX98787.1 hypothetical protein QRX60_32610 [Amycolatopsis sp. 4-36]